MHYQFKKIINISRNVSSKLDVNEKTAKKHVTSLTSVLNNTSASCYFSRQFINAVINESIEKHIVPSIMVLFVQHLNIALGEQGKVTIDVHAVKRAAESGKLEMNYFLVKKYVTRSMDSTKFGSHDVKVPVSSTHSGNLTQQCFVEFDVEDVEKFKILMNIVKKNSNNINELSFVDANDIPKTDDLEKMKELYDALYI